MAHMIIQFLNGNGDHTIVQGSNNLQAKHGGAMLLVLKALSALIYKYGQVHYELKTPWRMSYLLRWPA